MIQLLLLLIGIVVLITFPYINCFSLVIADIKQVILISGLFVPHVRQNFKLSELPYDSLAC